MTAIAKSHKEQNAIPLTFLAFLYGLSCFIVVEGGIDTVKEQGLDHRYIFGGLVLPIAGSLVSIFLVGQINPIGKARLIFWRWNNPLPGGEAFSKWGRIDPRVDETQVCLKHGPLPIGRAEQNHLWYRMYRTVAEETSVADANRHYLLCRDATVVSFILGFICSAIVIVASGCLILKPVYVLSCVVVFVMANWAARLGGYRLVIQVLILNPDVEQSEKSKIIVP